MPLLGNPENSANSLLSSTALRNIPLLRNFNPLLYSNPSAALPTHFLPNMAPTQNDVMYQTGLMGPQINPNLVALLSQPNSSIIPLVYNSLRNQFPGIQAPYEYQEEAARNMKKFIENLNSYSHLNSSGHRREFEVNRESSPERKRNGKIRAFRSPLRNRPSSLSPAHYESPASISSPNAMSPGESEVSPLMSGPSSSLSNQSSNEKSRLTINTKVIDSTTPMRKNGAKSTNQPEKKFICDQCDKGFGYKHVLQNHQRTHTGEKPYSCNVCNKKFTRDHHLKTHARLHTGEKPYQCSTCNKTFVQVANLRRHTRVHTGEKPYPCNECDSKFSDSNQLKSHRLIHKGEKPFSCELCNTQFRRKHHLSKHKCISKNSPPNAYPLDQSESLRGFTSIPETSPIDNYSPSCSIVNPIAISIMNMYNQANSPMVEENKRERKPKFPLRYVDKKNSPEQTEPEDLSMNTASTKNYCFAKVELRPTLSSSPLIFSDKLHKKDVAEKT